MARFCPPTKPVSCNPCRKAITGRATAPGKLTPGRWHHLTAAYDGSRLASGIRIYVNGDPVKLKVNLDDLKRQALESRPDVEAARLGVKLAQDAAALERGNRARDVTGDVGYSHTGPDNLFGVGFSIDLPVHDRNQGNIARSDIAVRQASEAEAAARFMAVTDVVNAYAAFETNQKVVSLYQSGYLDQARQSLDITTYVYQHGAGTLLDLLDAERTFRETELAYRDALAAYVADVRSGAFPEEQHTYAISDEELEEFDAGLGDLLQQHE